MSSFPYVAEKVAWKRPGIDKDILRACTRKSNFKGFVHSLGVLAILTASGATCYWLFVTQRWVLLAVALYVHGGLFAFNPQTHEFSHRTVFKTRWLNDLFAQIFGLLHWTGNISYYRMSHTHHHFYTLHSKSDGERVVPRVWTTQNVMQQALMIVDPVGLAVAAYDQIYALLTPYDRNVRRSPWQRYVYSLVDDAEHRRAYRIGAFQFLFHLAFAVFAILTGHWFLIIVVSLPQFYGGRWYHMLVHDTMHVGRDPNSDDFRKCCRTVKLDPFTSFLYWHMEWHVEHHTFAAVPCYNLKRFHRLSADVWDPPQSIAQAWREMNASSRELLLVGAEPQETKS